MVKKICIDPGHGFGNVKTGKYDPGAGAAGVNEADIVLAHALAIKWVAVHRGIEVFLTRDDSSDVTPVGQRDDQAMAAGCDLFISLHCNAGGPTAKGTETYYRSAEDKLLATRINTAVVKALGTRNRGVKHESQSQHPKLAVFGFNGPACLVELGFITNKSDRELLLTRDARLAVAKASLDTLETHYGPLK